MQIGSSHVLCNWPDEELSVLRVQKATHNRFIADVYVRFPLQEAQEVPNHLPLVAQLLIGPRFRLLLPRRLFLYLVWHPQYLHWAWTVQYDLERLYLQPALVARWGCFHEGSHCSVLTSIFYFFEFVQVDWPSYSLTNSFDPDNHVTNDQCLQPRVTSEICRGAASEPYCRKRDCHYIKFFERVCVEFIIYFAQQAYERCQWPSP